MGLEWIKVEVVGKVSCMYRPFTKETADIGYRISGDRFVFVGANKSSFHLESNRE
jgi:hypothetical protein